MAALHDFACNDCSIYFEAIGTYNDSLRAIEPVECPQCAAPARQVWLKAPGVESDGNLSAEERVAGALKLGLFADGRMSLPKTRDDMAKIRAAYGDLHVGEKEQLSTQAKRQRTDEEKRESKKESIELIRQRRAMRRAGMIPRVTVDKETSAAMERAPISSDKILAR